jgi:hypothetical protein
MKQYPLPENADHSLEKKPKEPKNEVPLQSIKPEPIEYSAEDKAKFEEKRSGDLIKVRGLLSRVFSSSERESDSSIISESDDKREITRRGLLASGVAASLGWWAKRSGLVRPSSPIESIANLAESIGLKEMTKANEFIRQFPENVPGGNVEKHIVPGADHVLINIRQLHPSSGFPRNDNEREYLKAIHDDIEKTLVFLSETYGLGEVLDEGNFFFPEDQQSYTLRHEELIKEVDSEILHLSNLLSSPEYLKKQLKAKVYEAKTAVTNPDRIRKKIEKNKKLRKKLKDKVSKSPPKSNVNLFANPDFNAPARLGQRQSLNVIGAELEVTNERAEEGNPDKRYETMTLREDILFMQARLAFRRKITRSPLFTASVFGANHNMMDAADRHNERDNVRFSVIQITPSSFDEMFGKIKDVFSS